MNDSDKQKPLLLVHSWRGEWSAMSIPRCLGTKQTVLILPPHSPWFCTGAYMQIIEHQYGLIIQCRMNREECRHFAPLQGELISICRAKGAVSVVWLCGLWLWLQWRMLMELPQTTEPHRCSALILPALNSPVLPHVSTGNSPVVRFSPPQYLALRFALGRDSFEGFISLCALISWG